MNPLCTLSIFPFISFSKRNLLSAQIALFRELNEKSAHRIGTLRLSKRTVTIDGDLKIKFRPIEEIEKEYECQEVEENGPYVFEYSTGEHEVYETHQEFFSFHLERPGTKIGLMILQEDFHHLAHLRLYQPFTIQLKLTFRGLSYKNLESFLASLSGREVKHLQKVDNVDSCYDLSSFELTDITIKKWTTYSEKYFVSPSLFHHNISLIVDEVGPDADGWQFEYFEELVASFVSGAQENSYLSCYVPHPDRIREGTPSAVELISCLTEELGFEHGYLRHLECLWKPMANNKTAYFLVGFRSEVTKYDFLDPFYRVKLICLEEKPTQHRCLEMKLLHWISVFQFHMATTYIHHFWCFLCHYTKLKKATLLVDAMRCAEKFQLPILLFLLILLCLPPFLLIFGFTLFNFLLYFIISSLFQCALHYGITRKFMEWADPKYAHFTDISLVLQPNQLPSVVSMRTEEE